MTAAYDVGGILLERPFFVRRLGHFHYLSTRVKESLEFYTKLLGFQITDTVDLSPRIKDNELLAKMGDPHLYFTRYGHDHHAFVLSSDRIYEVRGATRPPQMTVGQITWQVGSLEEVVNGHRWIDKQGLVSFRTGRDTPGSNWASYFHDPDGHANEIYYGIEQIGWDGRSKPPAFHRGFMAAPELPQIPEALEVQQAVDRGDDPAAGRSSLEQGPFDYAVGGIKLNRPFKITSIGPVRLMVRDMKKALHFYRDKVGLRITEEVVWQGHRCFFLRASTEHHSMALYPEAVGKILDLSPHSLCLSFGLRVNDYRQLKDAVRFLKDNNVQVRELPPELSPGIDYSAYAVDPDGHLVQLYYYMEQVGWDGRPRSPAERRKTSPGVWPEALEPLSDTYGGEQFTGPWA
ncbi:MAG: VOC family protein [Rhizomicrobium sp.]